MSNLDAIYDYKEDKFTSWNPVFNFVMELKYRYFGYFGRFDYSKSDNMVNYWADGLKDVGITKYSDMLKYVKVVPYKHLVLFKYNSIAVFNDEKDITLTDLWSMYDGIYRECRGIVIDIWEDELVITPYEKFFNLNEIEETMYDNIIKYMYTNNITTSDLEITEKIDGCIICARYYDGDIVVSGSGSLDPKINHVIDWAYNYICNNSHIADMIKIGVKSGLKRTYMFECVCPLETHVVNYSDDDHGLYLIGIRDVEYGFTFSYQNVITWADNYNIKSTNLYKHYTLDDIIAKIDDNVGDTHEGFVVNIDQDTGFRIKIKYSDYVQLAEILENISRNNIVKFIYNDKLDDVKSLLRTKNKLIVLEEIELCERIIAEYEEIYTMLVVKYHSRTKNMNENGVDIATIMRYINTLQPKYIHHDVINAFKGNFEYMMDPHYQLIKPGSRSSKDKGYLNFDTIKERLEEMKKILRKETVCETLEGGFEREL